MTGRKKRLADSFASAGTEGMLDVVLGCTLIFLLMSSLIQAGKSEHQEKPLPMVNLTKSEAGSTGATEIKKNVITLKKDSTETQIFFNDKRISISELKTVMSNLGEIGHIALRRDRELPCGVEDNIILMCREAGIRKVAIIVEIADKRKPN